MPEDFEGMFELPPGETQVLFVDFWKWFEGYVGRNDLLRQSAFDDAVRRMAEARQREQQLKEDEERRERAIQEVMDVRRALEDQFDVLTADMYINEELGNILNKGAFIDDPEGPDRQESTVALEGEHCELVTSMLMLWGCLLSNQPTRTWDPQAVAAFEAWQQTHGPVDATPGRLDATSLKRMIDRDAFKEEYLPQEYPLDESAQDDLLQMVELKGIVEGSADDLDVLIEAVSEETGELLQLSLPESQVAEVRRRLMARGENELVLARADLVSGRVTKLLSEDSRRKSS
jgi:hypothetical protein